MPVEVEVKSELCLDEPCEEFLEWAKKNLREDPDTRCQVLEDFRDLIYSRGECTLHRADDEFLLRFLRSRKFNLEAAHRLLVNFYDVREDLVDGVGFEILERAGACDVIGVPPYRDQTGKRILLYKFGKWNPKIFSMTDIFAASLLILELAILEPQAQIYGGICIMDCGGITMEHAVHMNPHTARKIFQLAVTSQPMRLEAMHIVNNSWMFETFFNMFRPFLNDKIKKRLHFHGTNMESLHKYVDPKCLPQIYGGVHPNYDYRDWIDGFRRNKTIVRELAAQGYAVP